MVIEKILKIEWTLLAKAQLKEVLSFYKSQTEQGHTLVKEAIIVNIDNAAKIPKIFAADKLKQNNDGTFRAFTVYHTRISYRFDEKTLTVLRLRHTSREPLEY